MRKHLTWSVLPLAACAACCALPLIGLGGLSAWGTAIGLGAAGGAWAWVTGMVRGDATCLAALLAAAGLLVLRAWWRRREALQASAQGPSCRLDGRDHTEV